MIESQKVAREDELSLREIIQKFRYGFRFVLSRWYVIVLFAITGGIAGYFYNSKKETLYTAVCTFVVEGGQPAGSQATGLAALLTGSTSTSGGAGLFQGSTLISLYTTRLMLEKTLFSSVRFKGKNILLMDWYLQINRLGSQWSKVPSKQKPAMLASAIGKIQAEYVKVSSANFVTVIVKSPNELFSKAFAEKLIETVNKFYITTKTKKSLNNLNILQKQADSLRRILTISMRDAAASADAYPNANPALRVLGVQAQRKAVDVQSTTALYSGVISNLETTKLELRKETPLIEIVDKPVLPLSQEVPNLVTGLIMGALLSSLLGIVVILAQLFYKQINV